jgi:hypothetical protein
MDEAFCGVLFRVHYYFESQHGTTGSPQVLTG